MFTKVSTKYCFKTFDHKERKEEDEGGSNIEEGFFFFFEGFGVRGRVVFRLKMT